jgi:MFS family permease
MNRDAKAGLVLGFISFLHNRRAMIIVGAVLIGVGAAGAISIGSILIQDYTTGNIDATTGRPYPILGIISLIHVQIIFIGIAIAGLALVAWYASGSRRRKS